MQALFMLEHLVVKAFCILLRHLFLWLFHTYLLPIVNLFLIWTSSLGFLDHEVDWFHHPVYLFHASFQVGDSVWELFLVTLRGFFDFEQAFTLLLDWALFEPIFLALWLLENVFCECSTIRGDQVLLRISLRVDLVVRPCKFQNLRFWRIFGRSDEEVLMFRQLLEMLDFLLAVQHLPALETENLSVGLVLDSL